MCVRVVFCMGTQFRLFFFLDCANDFPQSLIILSCLLIKCRHVWTGVGGCPVSPQQAYALVSIAACSPEQEGWLQTWPVSGWPDSRFPFGAPAGRAARPPPQNILGPLPGGSFALRWSSLRVLPSGKSCVSLLSLSPLHLPKHLMLSSD